jgi:cellobiose phosphorylase
VDFANRVAFFQCSESKRSITSDRTEFIGRNGSLRSPAAMRAAHLSNRVGAGLDPCAAMQAPVVLSPGQQQAVVFLLGAAPSEHDAHALLSRFGSYDGARQELEAVWELWKRLLGGIHVATPDPAVNFLVNHWLLYQALAGRFWGRSGYYQSGGAYGFRDQLQDSMAFLHECPWLLREQIVKCASRQFRQGDVQHWWHPPSGRGVRTRCSDDYLWLPYAVCRYVNGTRDVGVLDEQIPFLEGRPLSPGEESSYEAPQAAEERASLYEHCVRAIRNGLKTGAHGLPLIGSGDWNDALNRVGQGGKGESVWLALFLYDVLAQFSLLAESRADHVFAGQCRDAAAGLKSAIERNAWDGDWYLRAFFDDGHPLGSAKDAECCIDSLPQSWAVLSGAVDPQRAEKAVDSALARLVDWKRGLVKLLDPPFDAMPMDPGYIKGYVPGTRENGGQYTHAAVWLTMALASLRRTDQAWRMFSIINPISHADTMEHAATYAVEPYVAAADVCSAEGRVGRGGWTWYTGAAGWMYRLLVENLLGITLTPAGLSFAPLLPSSWNSYTIHYRHRSALYHIEVRATGAETWNVHALFLDDTAQADRILPLADDGKEHHVRLEVG